MKKFFTAIILFCVFAFAVLPAQEAFAIGELPINAESWLNIPLSEANKIVTSAGYSLTSMSQDYGEEYTIIFLNKKNDLYCVQVTYNKATLNTTRVFLVYQPNAQNAQFFITTYTAIYGEPTKSKNNNDTDMLTWETDEYGYRLMPVKTYEEMIDGTQQFGVVLYNKGAFDNKTASESAATPKPTPGIISEIIVTAVRLERNSAGTDKAYITLKNNSGYDVDRVDFYVKCYDAYGKKIKGNGIYDVSKCFYDEIIKAGSSIPSNSSWNLYGFTGTKKVEVAVISYHTTNGCTIEIPEDQLVWYSY